MKLPVSPSCLALGNITRAAVAVGVVAANSTIAAISAAMYINAAEMDYMTPNAKKITDAFFKTIMLDQFTRFTRVFAAGMGKRFLVGLAHNNEMDPVLKTVSLQRRSDLQNMHV